MLPPKQRCNKYIVATKAFIYIKPLHVNDACDHLHNLQNLYKGLTILLAKSMFFYMDTSDNDNNLALVKFGNLASINYFKLVIQLSKSSQFHHYI